MRNFTHIQLVYGKAGRCMYMNVNLAYYASAHFRTAAQTWAQTHTYVVLRTCACVYIQRNLIMAVYKVWVSITLCNAWLYFTHLHLPDQVMERHITSKNSYRRAALVWLLLSMRPSPLLVPSRNSENCTQAKGTVPSSSTSQCYHQE